MSGRTRSEWLNRNAYRAFPFEENSDFSCKDGRTLPLGLVLDARFCIFGKSFNREIRLVSAVVDDKVTATFSYGGGCFVVSGVGDVFGTIGDAEFGYRVTFCGREALEGLAGAYTLSSPPGMLPSRVLSVPYGIGVDTLTCDGVEGFGKIRVANGHNTELDIVGNALKLRIVKGGGTGPKCPDVKGEICHGRVLYYLDGQKADSDGSIWVKGSEGIATSTGTYKGIPAVFVKTSATIDSFIYR